MPRDIENSLTFLRVTESNIDELAMGLSDLRYTVSGQKYDPAYWRWCYFNNPVGKANTVVAVRAGQVVGKQSNVYRQMTVQGERVMAALMESLSVKPSERSWYCLRGLGEMSLAESRKDKVAFGFGLANTSTAELGRRLGLVNLGRAPIYSGFLNVARVLAGRSVPYPLSLAGWLVQPIVGLRIRGAGVSGLDIRPIERFDNSFDQMWNTIEKKRTVSLIKDAAYLNWQYVKCPGRRYSRFAAYRTGRLEGLVVFRADRVRRYGFVVELLARDDNPDTMKALLLRTFRELKTQGTGLVVASFPTYSQATAVMKDLGLKSWGTRLWNMAIVIATDRRKGSCAELDARNWDFSLGDWLYY